MRVNRGSRVFEGYALGKLAVYKELKVEKSVGLGPEEEFKRFVKARTETVQALNVSFMEALSKLGEKEAANNLADAARELSSAPGALHLRTLATLNDLSSDQSNTIIFAIPIEVLSAFGQQNIAKAVDKVQKLTNKDE